MAHVPPESERPNRDVWGSHEHKLDAKGRLSIPANFRNDLSLVEGSELIITRHLDERCLLVFWPEAWTRFLENAASLPRAQATQVKRIVRGYHRRIRLDRLGRVQLPQMLRKYARLDGSCLVMGQGQALEIWDEKVSEDQHSPEAIAAGVEVDLGSLYSD